MIEHGEEVSCKIYWVLHAERSSKCKGPKTGAQLAYEEYQGVRGSKSGISKVDSNSGKNWEGRSMEN